MKKITFLAALALTASMMPSFAVAQNESTLKNIDQYINKVQQQWQLPYMPKDLV
jgi:hypothetical protein